MFALFQIIALCAAIDPEPGYTIHLRELTAPERAVRLQPTDLHSVVDAVGSLKEKPADLERVDMWIVRRAEDGKAQVLKIDWTAITQQGVTSTNYMMLAGDRLFLQTRPVN